MRVITVTGAVDAAQSLTLSSDLSAVCRSPRPMIALDLRRVEKLHLSAINAIVQAAMATTRSAGDLVITPPTDPGALCSLKMAGLGRWLVDAR